MPSKTEAPAESKETNPVEAQEDSSGDRKAIKYKEKPDPTGEYDVIMEPVEAKEAKAKQKEFDDAVAEAVRTQFDVKPLAWGIKTVVKFIVRFPSGQTALVKHLDATDLVRHDLLEELDFFTKRLFPPAYDAAGNPVEPDDGERTDLYATLRDPKKRLRFLDLTNRLLALTVVKPNIVNDGVALRFDEKLGEEIDVFGYEVKDVDEQIALFGKAVKPLDDPEHETYAGTIDFTDRMHLFQALNQPLELIEPFREGSNALLENLEREQVTGDSTE